MAVINGDGGPNTLNGTADGDTINGYGGNDIINGNGGDDIIDPGAGNDNVNGGTGYNLLKLDYRTVTAAVGGTWDDIYRWQYFSSSSGRVDFENISRFEVHLSDLADTIDFQNASGGVGDSKFFGYAGNDYFIFNSFYGDLFIDGGSGADFMQGGHGSDVYIVDNVGDWVADNPTHVGSVDEVRTTLSNYVLESGRGIERLTYIGSGSFTGTGTGLSDYLAGGVGNDLLDGKGGKDTLIGGLGDDTYVVDDIADVVTEASDGGTDTIKTSVGSRVDYTRMYVLPGFVENLFGTGPAAQGVYGNSLDNVVTMSDGGDLIVMHDGGNDTVISGGGDDFIYYGGSFTNADKNDGGAGFDTLGLVGTYTSLTFDADDLVGIEKVAVYGGGSAPGALTMSYNLATIDANVGAGKTLIVVGLSLRENETLTFDGSAEMDGTFNIRGGKGTDNLTGGAGIDQIYGNLGADQLRGNGGNDMFEYYEVAESTATQRDTILDFSRGDKLNLIGIDADGDAANGNTSFRWIGSNAFSGVAGQLRVTGSGSTWLVEGDVNGDGMADLVIQVSTTGGHQLGVPDIWF